ncbi:hypothetical protein BDW62DRAFT_94582 [Aspergillus aurantiobrunneus]
MSSSDHFLSLASAPLFARRPPITAAPDPHWVLRVFSLLVFVAAPGWPNHSRSPSPRRPLLPLLSSPLLPCRPLLQRKRPSQASSAISLSYHRPRLKSLLHCIRPRALPSSPPNPGPRPFRRSNVWRSKQPPLELNLHACKNPGPLRRSCARPPSGLQTQLTTSHATHR